MGFEKEVGWQVEMPLDAGAARDVVVPDCGKGWQSQYGYSPSLEYAVEFRHLILTSDQGHRFRFPLFLQAQLKDVRFIDSVATKI